MNSAIILVVCFLQLLTLNVLKEMGMCFEICLGVSKVLEKN